MKKIFSLALILILIVSLLFGCGASSKESVTSPEYYDETSETAPESEEANSGGELESSDGVKIQIPEGRKVILNANIDMETLDFAKTVSDLNDAIKNNGGYISDSSQSGGGLNESRRDINITARIPTDSYNNFLKQTDEVGNVTYKHESSDDVTAAYIDVEARLVALKEQEARLLSILEDADDLESVITLESRMSDVRYEIEGFEAQKRTFDDLISYSTVIINVEEVKTITEENDTFAMRVSHVATDSWSNFGYFMEAFLWEIMYFVPFLIIWITLFVIAVIVIKIIIKKKGRIYRLCKRQKNKHQQPPMDNSQGQDNQDKPKENK